MYPAAGVFQPSELCGSHDSSHEMRALSPLTHTYRYEDEKYKTEPFDVVIDCIGWRDEWKEAYRRGVLKSAWKGGRYISIACTDDPQVHTVWQVSFDFWVVEASSSGEHQYCSAREEAFFLVYTRDLNEAVNP